MHISIPLDQTCEFINITPVNPLISKCHIKVCYVSDEPNRNGTVITKEVARKMANSLPGCPIVGFYNKSTKDFEEHNRVITISNGEINIADSTIPYGFVDINAKVWFKKFRDDGVEHEYLMTEGYIWTGQYEEAKRIITHGNNQSMELDENSVKGNWSEQDNGDFAFFIISDAIISKLCILGEDFEPCFEGAQITTPQFSLNSQFKAKFTEMANELKDILKNNNKGGSYSMDKTEVLEQQEEVLEEKVEEEEKPTIILNPQNVKSPEEEGLELVCEFPADGDIPNIEEETNVAEPELVPAFSFKDINEVPEYVELKEKYSHLEDELNALNAEIVGLREFKAAADKKAKLDMVAGFYMLSDEDKKEVVDNIDNYSLDDIEAKLSILCVRNKVNFNLNEENKEEINDTKSGFTYSLDNVETKETTNQVPDWVRSVQETQKNL